MKFSVVIPTYNRAGRIMPTLESVLSQIGPEDEVVLVDDGGTDNTAEVVAPLGGRVRYIRQANGGPGTARNTGIAAAGGDYIALLDSDDLWMPWTMDLVRDAIERQGRPAVIAGEQYVFRDEEELRKGREGRAPARQEMFTTLRDLFAKVVSLPVTGAFFRADVLKQSGGFITERINAEDGDLILRICGAPGCVYFFEPPLYAVGRVGDHRRVGLSMDPGKVHRGMRKLLEREGSGMYGGAEGRLLRWAYITASIRSAVFSLAHLGARREGWDLYWRTLVMNLRLLRLRFLLGAPLILLLGRRG